MHPKWNYRVALYFFGSLCKFHTDLFWVIPPGIIESHFDFLSSLCKFHMGIFLVVPSQKELSKCTLTFFVHMRKSSCLLLFGLMMYSLAIFFPMQIAVLIFDLLCIIHLWDECFILFLTISWVRMILRLQLECSLCNWVCNHTKTEGEKFEICIHSHDKVWVYPS